MRISEDKKLLSGWINFYKAEGLSSNKAMFPVKKMLIQLGFSKKDIKIGYLGTLDPFACGLLPIAIGEGLKTIQFIQDESKTYIFTLKFGETTDTLDNTGEIIATSKIIPSQEEILSVLSGFVGEITQIPPKYSALKINGQRAYKLAREGIDFEVKSRTITIHSLELLRQESLTEYKFQVKCSKGTYVRTLSADIAEKLGSCGHLTYLERTQNSCFKKEDSISLDIIDQIVQNKPESKIKDADSIKKILYPIDSVLDGIPVVSISNEEKHLLETGIVVNKIITSDQNLIRCHYNNQLVAICENIDNKQLKVKRVFN